MIEREVAWFDYHPPPLAPGFEDSPAGGAVLKTVESLEEAIPRGQALRCPSLTPTSFQPSASCRGSASSQLLPPAAMSPSV